MFLRDQIKEQKIIEMEVNFDDFIEENNISEEAMIYKMEFDASVFQEEKEVREYLKDKYVYNPAIEKSDNKFIAILLAPNQVDLDTEIDVELRRGVQAYAADLNLMPQSDTFNFNDKGEALFSCYNLFGKNDTINLNEGVPHIIEISRVAEGEHPLYGKLKITQEHLENMEFNFKSKVTGVDLAVNEDHKKNEAFGWLKDVYLSFDKQVLYGLVAWNSKGTSALSEKEYRYFSPEFRFNYVHPHTGKEHGATLLGGALTNYPFLKMDAITELNNKKQKEGQMSKEQTIDLSVHNEKVVELNSKITEIQGKLDASKEQNVELSNKVTELEKSIAKEKQEKVHNKLFTEGKINKAQLVALNEGKGLIEVISLNENLNTNPKGSSDKPKETIVELSDKEKEVAKTFGLTEEEFIEFNKGE